MLLEPTCIEELQEAVRFCRQAIPVGAGTKPALSAVAEDFQRISTLHLSGIVEYEPTEFTITVLAGTPLKDIEKALNKHGQYLPFDPPLSAAGATIGGTVASGLSGPGAFRYGPIRDFLIGVRFVDGEGRLIMGGGKVVKNAAGFDLPKFLIGSCGRFGVLAELTFKVFPKPEAQSTFGIAPRDLKHALQLMAELSRRPFDLEALDYEPTAKVLWGRISGNRDALENRLQSIDKAFGLRLPITICEPAEADYFWKHQLAFDWSEQVLAKIPITPKRIETLEFRTGLKCVYSMGGNIAWVDASERSMTTAAAVLKWPMQVIRSGKCKLPSLPDSAAVTGARPIDRAIKKAFDPTGKFPPFSEPRPSNLRSEGPSPIDSRPASD